MTKERRAEYHREYRKRNKTRINAINRRYRKSHPQTVKAWELRARHKPYIGQVTLIPAACQICGAPGKLFLDHDHKTSKFRGWLCRNCNTALGMFKDSTQTLQNAILYLTSRKDP